MDLGLKDKIAIVSGASKGIGKAIALELAREGCKVILCARGEEDLQDAANEVGEVGYASAVPADVTKAEEVERLVGETVDRHGGVDILVNNAGGIGRPAAFEELSDEEWFEVLDLNLLSAVRFTRAVLPQMRKQRWGRIINVASESGIQPDPFMPHYNASKAAVHQLTKSLAAEWAPHHVRVNALAPGYVKTAMAPVDEPRFRRHWIEDAPMQRYAVPDELGPSLVYLASDASSFMSGSVVLVVDGGYTLW